MSLFQKSVINKYLNNLDKVKVDDAWSKFRNHFHNKVIQQNIRKSKEEQYQGEFLIDLFVNVFDYIKNPAPEFNLTTELKNVKGAKKTDGAILKDEKALAVIELKGTNTTDLAKVEAQAFGYKNNQPGCNYVITSNFEKLRFYIDNAVDFEDFNLFELTRERFDVLFICLSSEYLLKDIPKKIKNESLTQEEDVTKKLYKDYASFRNEIFDAIQKENSEYDKLTLFKKTQKLLDRFLFIFFAEDRLLLPPNSIRSIINKWTDLRDKYDEYFPLYDRFRKYFGYMNTGYKGQDYEIFAYNGGLFAPDDILDNIKINDDLLHRHTVNLSNYNFESEVSVNILGHIFEHSLNDIDEIQAEIQGNVAEKGKTKRKKDGVFYTPKYITKYIVDSTVGKICEEKKTELGIDNEEYEKDRKGRQKKKLKELLVKLENYRDWLLGVTICDPACGSGAFLNQALEFLISEHRYIDELNTKLLGESLPFPNIENSILENNLFGVDINEESVEIAKLSLWLRTAQKGRKLTSLNNNIKCGNSLIDDVEVAGDKAFNWQNEFSDVFAKGGFDVVIGNPPYGIFIDEKQENFLRENYPLTSYKINLYILFVEKMLYDFKGSLIHFIIPKSLLFNSFYEKIRKYLLENSKVEEILTISDKVFQDAEVGDSLLLKYTPNSIKPEINLINQINLISLDKFDGLLAKRGIFSSLSQNYFSEQNNCEIVIADNSSVNLKKKILDFNAIKDYYILKNGLNPGNIKHILISGEKSSENHKPIIWGKNISKYRLEWSGDFVNYDENIANSISLSDIKSKEGMKKQNRIDFALRKPVIFDNDKIIVRKTGDSLIATFDDKKFYYDTLVHGILQKKDEWHLKYLLGILNSRASTFFYRILHDIKGKVFAKISLTNLSDFPIPKPDKTQNEAIINKVNFLLDNSEVLFKIVSKLQRQISRKFEIEKLSKKLQNWHTLTFQEFVKELKKKKIKLGLSEEAEWEDYFESEKEKVQFIQVEIDKTDKEIDQMVYQLYGLTEEEIRIVEEATK